MSHSQWQYDPATDFDRALLARLQSIPRRPDMLIYAMRSAAAITLRAWLASYHRLRIQGRENLPASGSRILVANHCSHLDALCILSALPVSQLHRTYPAAARDYFFVSSPRTAFFSIFINAMPFGRHQRLRQSLDLCRRILDQPGNTLILFPEGTRSTTGAPGDFRPGIGHLVAGTNIPVVPCAVHGSWRAWPKGARLPRPSRIRLTIGKPRTYADLSPTRSSAQTIAQDLEHAVEELLCK